MHFASLNDGNLQLPKAGNAQPWMFWSAYQADFFALPFLGTDTSTSHDFWSLCLKNLFLPSQVESHRVAELFTAFGLGSLSCSAELPTTEAFVAFMKTT